MRRDLARSNVTFLDFEAALHRHLVEPGAGKAAGKPVDAKAVAPYLGLYWFDPVKCPVAMEVRGGQLWAELPWQAEAELVATDRPDKWAVKLSPTTVFEFRRDWENPATALVLHQDKGKLELPRLKKDDGLPTADEVLKRRETKVGTARLAGLGGVRVKGTVEQHPAGKKGAVEYLMDGPARYRLEATVGGETEHRWADGARA